MPNIVHFSADAIPIAADPPVAKSGDIPLVKGDKKEITERNCLSEPYWVYAHQQAPKTGKHLPGGAIKSPSGDLGAAFGSWQTVTFFLPPVQLLPWGGG